MSDGIRLNREAWLAAATDALRPRLADAGATVPELVHVSTGWPSRKATSARNRTIGQCWHPETSSDGAPHVFISPTLSDSVAVLATLVHELIHAAGALGHKSDFGRSARKLGLEGKLTATHAGVALAAELAIVAEAFGPYPHAAISPGGHEPKQSTRLLKVDCPDCGYTIRVTAKWVAVGLPTCPCGGGMESAA